MNIAAVSNNHVEGIWIKSTNEDCIVDFVNIDCSGAINNNS